MKSWWSGDQRVEPFMIEVMKTLDKYKMEPDQRTDIYNRAYEAVYRAIKQYDKSPIKNVLRKPLGEK